MTKQRNGFNREIWFGKYKGRKFIELPEEYLDWICCNFGGQHDARKCAKKALQKRNQWNKISTYWKLREIKNEFDKSK